MPLEMTKSVEALCRAIMQTMDSWQLVMIDTGSKVICWIYDCFFRSALRSHGIITIAISLGLV